METINDMFSPYYMTFLTIIWVIIFIYQVVAKHSWVNILIVSLVISGTITAIGFVQFDIIGMITDFIGDFVSDIFDRIIGTIVKPVENFFDQLTLFLKDLFSFDWWPF